MKLVGKGSGIPGGMTGQGKSKNTRAIREGNSKEPLPNGQNKKTLGASAWTMTTIMLQKES